MTLTLMLNGFTTNMVLVHLVRAIGLDWRIYVRSLTQQTLVTSQLRIDLTDFGGTKTFAEYRSFLIDSMKNKYSLYVSGYNQNSTAGDSLEESNGLRFTTSDSDNDYSGFPIQCWMVVQV